MKNLQIKNIYPLTPMQAGLLFNALIDKKSEAYFEQMVLSIEGSLDIDVFEMSFNRLIERYDILRTVFMYDGVKQPLQTVLNERHAKIYFEDISQMEEVEKVSFIEEFKRKDMERRFDLTKDILMRISVLQTGKEAYKVLWSYHHILMDGWCLGIITKEFFSIYQALKGNKPLSLGTVYPYSNYIRWLEKQDKEEASLYWKEYLEGYERQAVLPKQRSMAEKDGYKLEEVSFMIDERLTKGLEAVAERNQVTLNTLFQTIWGILLQRYNNVEDVVFGSVVSGRPHEVADIENMVGLFINTIPVRIKCNKTQSFSGLAKQIQESAFLSQKYNFFPLYEIQSNTGLKQGLVNHIMAFENYPVEKEFENIDGKQGVKFSINGIEVHEQSNYNLNIIIIPGNEIRVRFNFNGYEYDRFFIKEIEGHFKKTVQEIVKNPDVLVQDADILTEEEKRQILFDFNNSIVEYQKDKTVQELFEEQVEKTPDNIAVVFESEQLTYRELNEKSNRLARILRKKGVKPDSMIGLIAERSIEMITGIFGIIKAGGAYLPIDPGYPEERIKYMLEDSKTNILLKYHSIANKAAFEGEIIDLDDDMPDKEDASNLSNENKANDLVYVIYTSGTTGKPNGVMIEHKNVINLITGLVKSVYGRYDVFMNIALVAPYIFDASVQQIFASLLLGHKLFIVPEKARMDGKSLLQYYIKNSIDISDGTPTHLRIISDNISSIKKDMGIKHFIIGGEALPGKVVEELSNKFNGDMPDITNVYGPTECCVDSTAYLIKYGDTYERAVIPIGTPLANERIYILGENSKIVPIGVTGEIHIAGKGVGRGYLNNPDLTVKRFVPDPFTFGEKMYRTGDLARWLPDGNIEFMGRMDHQVKIRGHRIELGEIESQLLRHGLIKEAIVITREDANGDKNLYAYIVSDEELTISELREYLSKELPEYMIPSYFIQIEKIPLTQNGKVDRKALPEPGWSMNTGMEYTAPRNEIEEKLACIWREVLKLEEVGINDNFFELGGHSLRAMSLVSKIHKMMNVEVPLGEVFNHQTIKELGEYIKGMGKNIYSSIVRIEEREYYPVSSAQKRLFIINQIEDENTAYNVPAAMMIEGKLDKGRFEEVFKQLIERHETLRTSFKLVNGEPVQIVHKSVDFEINCIQSEECNIKEIIGEFIRPFDLRKAPLLRLSLISLSDYRHILLYDMHHIISDGTSMGILIWEFVDLYEGKKLPELRIQYKDFSAWQNGLFDTGVIKKQEEYWLNIFSGEIPVLDMPTDYPRPSIQSFEGDSISFKVDKEMAERLIMLASETGTTLYMVLLAAYNILLSKYSGQEDIIVGSPVAGRQHADLENVIGMFVNTLAMRNYPEHHKKFKEFLEELKENSLKAYENQEYQFEELVDNLVIVRDLSRNPLFDTMFALQNMDNRATGITELKFTPYEYENRIAKFDLSLTAVEERDGIGINIEYSTKLFKKETIERMAGHFVNILGQTVENPDIMLSEIDILTEVEKRKILYEFNDTKAEYPRNKTIHKLFEEQVEKMPDNMALVFAGEQLTYGKLNEKSNQLARVLREKGVKPDSIVGITAERSIETITGMLGILKAGGAYLPINPKYPEERKKYMLEDSGADILLTQHGLLDKAGFKGEVISLTDEGLFSAEDRANLEQVNKAQDLAYIMYTSGTTGKPKGTMIEHRNVVRLVKNTNYIKLDKEDRILQTGAIVFDACTFEIWGALLNGSGLYLVEDDVIFNAEKMGESLSKYKITTLWLTTPLFYQLTHQKPEIFNRVKNLLVGGDVLSPKYINIVRRTCKNTKVINFYGPTENTTFSTYFEIDKEYEENIPIGKPISNSTAYIFGRNDMLQGIGIPGELCAGGDGLARGYMNAPVLTAEKFVPNPYMPGERMYRTGDLAKWLPDGNIEFLGRMDQQVKIRGFRVEMGEIEYHLLKHELIKEAVVIAREDANGNKNLCAYVVSGQKPEVSELREYLLKELPEYMIPSYFIQLEKIPLTPNAKIDRRALPEPGESISTGAEYVAPEEGIEKILAGIWQEILGIEKVGINDNFFELGGNSIKIIMLISKIYDEFRVEVSLKQIYENPTIRKICELYLQEEFTDSIKIEAILLNIKKERNIFTFPPAGASAIYYVELARYIDSHSFYSFNILYPKNYIQSWVNLIMDLQKEKPCILFGYSSGGNLAFEVAKELIKRGLKVSDIILLDSSMETNLFIYNNGNEKEDFSKSLYKFVQKSLLSDLKTRDAVNKNLFKRELNDLYLKNIIKNGMIDSNIHLIATKAIADINDMAANNQILKNNRRLWRKCTTGAFKQYKGYGSHADMMSPPHIEMNAAIINEILKDIG